VRAKRRGVVMSTLLKKMRNLASDDEGQDIIEYALLAAFIAIVAAVILVNIGPLIEDIYTQVQEALEEA
jgi:pilus assembly protein Flp/PilA